MDQVGLIVRIRCVVRCRMIIWVIFILIGIGLAVNYKPHYPCQLQFTIPWGVSKANGEYVVVGRLYSSDDPAIDIHRPNADWEVSVSHWRSAGPWYGRIEFYDKLEHPFRIYNTDHNNSPQLGRDEYPKIKSALQHYFDENGLLPEDGFDTRVVYTFLPRESLVSLSRIIGLLLISYLLAWIIDRIWKLARLKQQRTQ